MEEKRRPSSSSSLSLSSFSFCSSSCLFLAREQIIIRATRTTVDCLEKMKEKKKKKKKKKHQSEW